MLKLFLLKRRFRKLLIDKNQHTREGVPERIINNLRMIPKSPVLERVWPKAREKEVTPSLYLLANLYEDDMLPFLPYLNILWWYRTNVYKIHYFRSRDTSQHWIFFGVWEWSGQFLFLCICMSFLERVSFYSYISSTMSKRSTLNILAFLKISRETGLIWIYQDLEKASLNCFKGQSKAKCRTFFITWLK